jgi:hypothetical protein
LPSLYQVGNLGSFKPTKGFAYDCRSFKISRHAPPLGIVSWINIRIGN